MSDISPPSAGYDGRPPEGARAGSGAAQRSARPPSAGYDDRTAEGMRAGSRAAQRSARRWPRWLRRKPMEMLACIVITLGLLMMLQPIAMLLFTWSFVTTLFGTAMFMVVSKFPE